MDEQIHHFELTACQPAGGRARQFDVRMGPLELKRCRTGLRNGQFESANLKVRPADPHPQLPDRTVCLRICGGRNCPAPLRSSVFCTLAWQGRPSDFTVRRDPPVRTADIPARTSNRVARSFGIVQARSGTHRLLFGSVLRSFGSVRSPRGNGATLELRSSDGPA